MFETNGLELYAAPVRLHYRLIVCFIDCFTDVVTSVGDLTDYIHSISCHHSILAVGCLTDCLSD